ncbi:hypothetical protein FGB62_169g03 [Gracilaria domingensis]|nr:hypothetical protein FGB62_169g03 [Gracilaria domingensis]
MFSPASEERLARYDARWPKSKRFGQASQEEYNVQANARNRTSPNTKSSAHREQESRPSPGDIADRIKLRRGGDAAGSQANDWSEGRRKT